MLQGLLISFSWQDLWFLRPYFFWGFVPVGAIALMFLLTFRRREEWKKSFSKVLLPHITMSGTRRQFFLPRILLILLLGIMVLALAGPTWEEREQPGNRTEAAMVLVMDLSPSMLAQDIQPNRLERGRLKMKDLFAARPGIRTALVAYAGSAHLVVPFTKDYSVISDQMDALNPAIMPLMGTNLDDALDLADSLLTGLDAPGSILLLTDGLREHDVERIRESASAFRLELMIIGTPGGASIPAAGGVMKDRSGETVVAGFDPALLIELGSDPGVNIVPVTLDDSDVSILALHIRQNLEYQSDPQQAETDWKDAGYWMVIPLVLLSLFWFRRGWMVHWIWLLFFLPACNTSGDLRLADMFRTRDQQGASLMAAGRSEEAARRFESDSWRAFAHAQAGQLEEAMEAYAYETNAQGFYNLGVLYARTGNADAAREAFRAALELDPELGAARKNLERVEQVLDSLFIIGERERSAPDQDEDRPENFEEPGKMAENQEQAQDSDQQYKGQGDISETGSRELDESAIDFFDPGGDPTPFNPENARESLLRQVEEDASLFLRRKFAYQLRNRSEKPQAGDESW